MIFLIILLGFIFHFFFSSWEILSLNIYQVLWLIRYYSNSSSKNWSEKPKLIKNDSNVQKCKTNVYISFNKGYYSVQFIKIKWLQVSSYPLNYTFFNYQREIIYMYRPIYKFYLKIFLRKEKTDKRQLVFKKYVG